MQPAASQLLSSQIRPEVKPQKSLITSALELDHIYHSFHAFHMDCHVLRFPH